ncbi:MAG TPA: hypothetical protein VJQ43_04460, partial [Thermoplasmata archaeon]|nr:hypothetical protein [Thermoplasmata archaeon]
INAAGVVVAAGVNTTPLDHKLVTTPVNGCTAHLYFSGSGGPNQAVAVPFVVPAGAYNMITTIAIVSTVLFTQDSCAVLGVDWGMPAPWTWTHNPTCPPLLAPPALPPTGANTGMVLLSATIV